MFEVTVQGRFLKRLEERRQAWVGRKIASRIRVPDSLKWWYYQEFGTATHHVQSVANTVNVAPIAPSTKPGGYEIVPVEAKQLVFKSGGATQFRDSVEHPGIHPKHIVSQVLPEVRKDGARLADSAFQKGAADNPGLLAAAIKDTADKAKQRITESIATHLRTEPREADPKYPKQAGRLHGQSPASVFERDAEVVNLSSEG